MKVVIGILMLITVFAGIGALGTGMGTMYSESFPALCTTSVISGLVFLYLAARQSRIDSQK